MDAALAELRRELAGPDLALADLFAAGQRIRAQAATWQAAPDMPTTRIAVLGGLTLDYLGAAIGCAAVQEGAARSCYLAPYGAWVQEVLDPQSGLHRFRPDVVVLAIDRRDVLEPLPPDAGEAAVAEAVAAKVRLFQRLWDVLHTGLAPACCSTRWCRRPRGFAGRPSGRCRPRPPITRARSTRRCGRPGGMCTGSSSTGSRPRSAAAPSPASGSSMPQNSASTRNSCRTICPSSAPRGGPRTGGCARSWHSISTTRSGAA